MMLTSSWCQLGCDGVGHEEGSCPTGFPFADTVTVRGLRRENTSPWRGAALSFIACTGSSTFTSTGDYFCLKP